MNALVQVFMFIFMLCIGNATQAPKRARAHHSRHQKLLRREVVHIDSASSVQHIRSAASKKQHTRSSEFKGKIEQGGFCLAAVEKDLDYVNCSETSQVWTTKFVNDEDETMQIKVQVPEGELCLEATEDYELELETCEELAQTPEEIDKLDRQSFLYNNFTNEIKLNTEDQQCVTYDVREDIVTLEACTSPVASNQEFVFNETHHRLAASSGTLIIGKIAIKHDDTFKCIAAHETSEDSEDLEVVSCRGDGFDDEEWQAYVESDPQQIRLRSSVAKHHPMCLTADSALEEVALKRCHTHGSHHRQNWIYDHANGEFKMKDTRSADDSMCLAIEPPEDKLLLKECSGGSDQNWTWAPDLS